MAGGKGGLSTGALEGMNRLVFGMELGVQVEVGSLAARGGVWEACPAQRT